MTFDTAVVIAFALLGVAGALCVLRLVMGPTPAQRVVALDALIVVVVSGIAVHSAGTGRAQFVDVILVLSLVGFAGTVTAAWLIEKRGSQ